MPTIGYTMLTVRIAMRVREGVAGFVGERRSDVRNTKPKEMSPTTKLGRSGTIPIATVSATRATRRCASPISEAYVINRASKETVFTAA